jgi:uncharacterized protein YciI
MSEATMRPVRREVRVECDPATAFELFTAHIGSWWPLGTHSVHGARASVAFEEDRLVERIGSDSAVWGTVLAWDRPRGFRMTWHPGHGPERPTEVAVSFAEDGAGTMVTLVHTGWERLANGVEAREEYDHGWPDVLEEFGHRVGGSPRPDGGGDGEAWFTLRHRPGPELGDEASVFAHPLFREHVAFLNGLRERGWLVAAGPVSAADGEGMAVVRVPLEQGGGVALLAHEGDRSVVGGLLTVEVQPWDVRFTG